ncbi:30S ribosomal protein S14 [Candidatus Woesearchaeota archaeon]|nr:30S ribosomal protein S14 [Candidatus Woesearchaeota archaeon]
MLKKYNKHNKPKTRSCGKNLKKCRRCERRGAHIASYGLGLCRQCFREIATSIGFKKMD